MDLHFYMSSCSFLCFHHPIFLFKYLICSLFLDLNDGFWSTSRRKICSMWIATATHFLLKVEEYYKTRHFGNRFYSWFSSWDLHTIFFHLTNFLHAQFILSDFHDVFHHAPYYRCFFLSDPLILGIPISMYYLCGSLHSIS